MAAQLFRGRRKFAGANFLDCTGVVRECQRASQNPRRSTDEGLRKILPTILINHLWMPHDLTAVVPPCPALDRMVGQGPTGRPRRPDATLALPISRLKARHSAPPSRAGLPLALLVDFVILVGDQLKLYECKWGEASPERVKGFEALEKLQGEGRIISKAVISPIRGTRKTKMNFSIDDAVELNMLSL